MPRVGDVDRLAASQPLRHHERRVEHRHGEHEERQHERRQRRRLEEALHRDRSERVPEEQRAGVAHEDARRIEVVAQEAEARAADDRGEHRRADAAEVELDHAERRAGDRAHARGETVEPVEEVDHVHDGDDPDHRHRHADPCGHLVHADEREALHVHAEAERRDRGREQLAAELLPPVQARGSRRPRRPSSRRPRRARTPRIAPLERQERDRRDDHAEEHREPAEARDLRPRALAFGAAARPGADSARPSRPQVSGRATIASAAAAP